MGRGMKRGVQMLQSTLGWWWFPYQKAWETALAGSKVDDQRQHEIWITTEYTKGSGSCSKVFQLAEEWEKESGSPAAMLETDLVAMWSSPRISALTDLSFGLPFSAQSLQRKDDDKFSICNAPTQQQFRKRQPSMISEVPSEPWYWKVRKYFRASKARLQPSNAHCSLNHRILLRALSDTWLPPGATQLLCSYYSSSVVMGCVELRLLRIDEAHN